MNFWAEASFRERSSWVMGVLLSVLGLWYFAKLGTAAWQPGGAVPLGLLARYVLWVIIGSIVAQTTLAVMNPHDASNPADERERLAAMRASARSGDVLGLGLISGLMWYLGHGDGVLLFHCLLASLIAAQAMEQFGTAFTLRRG
jgi:hypothetical protein